MGAIAVFTVMPGAGVIELNFASQIANRYYQVFLILYLFWSPFSIILLHQILFSNVIAD